jgi:mannitol/fructose-specific phosphotransferase system IIA component (Ntr-type)
MDLASLLTTRVAINELKATDDQGVFEEVAAALAASALIGAADCGRIRDAFMERERQGTTSLGNGLAVPHVFFEKVPAAQLVVARSSGGVTMRAPDGKPIRIFFCLVASEASRDDYLYILRSIAKVARDKDWRRYMERATTAGQIYEALIQGEKALSV